MSMGISVSHPDTRTISTGGDTRHSVVLVEHFGKYYWTGRQPKWQHCELSRGESGWEAYGVRKSPARSYSD